LIEISSLRAGVHPCASVFWRRPRVASWASWGRMARWQPPCLSWSHVRLPARWTHLAPLSAPVRSGSARALPSSLPPPRSCSGQWLSVATWETYHGGARIGGNAADR